MTSQDTKMSAAAIGAVLSRPYYATVAVVGSVVSLGIALTLPKIAIFKFILTFRGYSIGERTSFFLKTFFSFSFFPTTLSKITVIVLSICIGAYLALFVYFLQNRIASYRAAGLGWIGVVSGLLGIGCAACGSVVLMSLLGFSIAGSIITTLPFKGAELSIIGIAILLFSIFFLAKKIQDPLVCRI